VRALAVIIAMTVPAGCGPDLGATPETGGVPDVTGLDERAAVRTLAEAGLVAEVRYLADAPGSGLVRRALPDPNGRPVVRLELTRPLRPAGIPSDENRVRALSMLVEEHPEAFVGLYLDRQAVVRVVVGAGADETAWMERLGAAAGVVAWRTERCARTRTELRAVQDEIAADRSWTSNHRLAFATWVQPETCTVRIESDLLGAAEIDALVGRYGTALSFDTTPGSHPVRLTAAATQSTSP
jgi:hypothetical protein